MTALASWVAEVRDHLEGGAPQIGNQLGANYTAGSGTLSLAHGLGNVGEGSFLSVGTNTLLVVDVNTLTGVATVVGGQRGSTDQNATAGELVRVNPRFTDYQVVRELNNTLRQMSSPTLGLFQVASAEIDYAQPVEGYDLSGVSGLVKVLEVRRQTYGPSFAWPTVQADQWDLLESAPTSDFASGMSLRVIGADTGLVVQVLYAKTFTPIGYTLSTDVSVTGVTTEMEDIPPLGAAVRLMTGREVSRNNTDAQGDTRRANETPPGAIAASYRGLQQWFLQRVKEESTRLRAKYPMSI